MKSAWQRQHETIGHQWSQVNTHEGLDSLRLPVKNLDSVIVHAVRNLPESSDTNFKGIKSNEAFSQELKGNRLKKNAPEHLRSPDW